MYSIIFVARRINHYCVTGKLHHYTFGTDYFTQINIAYFPL